MNLVIDFGNTHTKIAWFDQAGLMDVTRHPNNALPDVNPVLMKKTVKNGILSSVGLPDNDFIRNLSKRLANLIILDHQTPLPISISYGTPETLGRDRIAAAAGANYIFPNRHVMVVDMGTAITIEMITDQGEYRGGNISPGLHTRFRALHKFTAKLPLVDSDPSFPMYGTDTRTALAAGVQQGIIFEINGYLNQFKQLYPEAVLVLTGGDAGFFKPMFRKDLNILPDLVLTGLNYILEYNTSGRSS